MPPTIDTAPTTRKVTRVELTLIEQLIIIRRRRGLTCKEAAKRWKLNARTLHSWETGDRSPRDDAKEALKSIVEAEEKKGF